MHETRVRIYIYIYIHEERGVCVYIYIHMYNGSLSRNTQNLETLCGWCSSVVGCVPVLGM